MFDARLRPLVDPVLNAVARRLGAAGVTANMITLGGLLVGLSAGWAAYSNHYMWALALIAINRIFDGLDGALARINGATDFGGYLDSLADFGFYVAVPLGFGFADPTRLPAASVLLASFTLTAVSFLALAAIAAKQGISDLGHGPKSFVYTTGLAEGGETIAVFMLMCLFPAWFSEIAFGFAALCLLTIGQRVWIAHKNL